MNNTCTLCHQQLDSVRNHPETGKSCPVAMQNYFNSLPQGDKDRIDQLRNQVCKTCNVKRKDHSGSFAHSFTPPTEG